MAKVPTYDNFSVTPSLVPSVQVNPALSAEQASFGTKQVEVLGEKIQNAGASAVNREVDELNIANQLRVDDAMNQIKEEQLRLTYDPNEGFSNIKGIDALQRESGKPLADEYSERLQGRIADISASLGNDAQRRMFSMNANDLATSFKGSALAHESGQFKEYALSVREGTINNRINEIGLNYRDPAAVAQAVNSIRAATFDQARLLGKSAEWAEAKANEMASTGHKTAILTAIQNNDALYADQYMKKHAKEMNADDILQVNGTLTKEVDGQIGLGTATTVMQEMGPRISTPDSDRAFNIALGTESNYRQFDATGKPLTSSAGAQGIAQVMPDTAPEAAGLAGLPWDPELYNRKRTGDPVKDKEAEDYNRALGKAYFEKQLKDNDGSLAKAYAAYNAGPGRLAEAIAAAEKKAPMIEVENPDGSMSSLPDASQANWLAELPKETQDYVAKNMKEFNAGQGQYQKPTLFELKQEVRARIGTDNPDRLKIALDEVERQYTDTEKAITQRNEQTKANAMRELIANGGSYAQLPAELRGQLDPNDVGTVMDFGKKIATGDDTTNLWLYNKFASDPSALANLSDDQFFALRTELSDSDFKKFSNERGAMINGTGENTPGTLPSGVATIVNDRMRMMGLDPTPDEESSEAARVGAMRRFINDSLLQAQIASGKKFDTAQATSEIDRLFSLTGEKHWQTFWGWQGGGTVVGYKKSDIPRATREAIEEGLKARGNTSPSEADILSVYWRQIEMNSKPKTSAKNLVLGANAGTD